MMISEAGSKSSEHILTEARARRMARTSSTPGLSPRGQLNAEFSSDFCQGEKRREGICDLLGIDDDFVSGHFFQLFLYSLVVYE